MKMARLVVCACALLMVAQVRASEPTLWAFDEGPFWSLGVSAAIDPDPFSASPATRPPGWSFLIDASYDMPNSILYVSGGVSTSPAWYYQNTIGVFSGGPAGLESVSSSNAGMGGSDGYHWLGGITYMDGSLYAIGFIGFEQGNVLLRIDNPGTATQTVTQIGPVLGETDLLGVPFNLCTDGRGSLLSIFRPSTNPLTAESTLYRIDPDTGSMTALHTYPSTLTGAYYVEGFTRSGDMLYGVCSNGRLIQFDPQSYDATVLGELGPLYPSSVWSGLVTIPEPSTVGVLGLALLAGVPWRRGLPGRPRRLR